MISYLLLEPYFHLIVAVLLGRLIGLDRAYRGRAAGFRTHILVCLASCLLMVMTGIGFLGAGAMMQDKQTIHGLK